MSAPARPRLNRRSAHDRHSGQGPAILRKTIPERLPVLLCGPPGVGKTAIVAQVAKELACELVVSHPVTADPTDFRGLPWMVDGQATFLPIGDLARLIALGDRPATRLDG